MGAPLTCTACGAPATAAMHGLFQRLIRCTLCTWTRLEDAPPAAADSPTAADAGALARDRGRAAASRGAGATWNMTADAALRALARHNPTLTPDDLRGALHRAGVHVWRANAVGGVFSRARDAGLIADTGRVQPSERAAARRRKVTIWRSLVYEPTALASAATRRDTGT